MLRDEAAQDHRSKRAQKKTQTSEEDEFDTLQVAIISFGEVLEGIHITMPYTIAAYMVRDFLRGHDASAHVDEEVVGRLTGLLASIFCAAQFVTSYGWGVFSDKYGRKPVLLVSIISGAATAAMFGMSSNYVMAAMARMLGGLLNATGGTVKTMLADTCSARTLPRALGFLGLSWGLGTMIGPFMGGALADPCTTFGPRFPLCHDDSLFMRRPYLLPCLAAAFLGACATLMSVFAVQETLPALQKDKKALQGDVEMAAVTKREAEGLLGGKAGPEGMRRPSARSFLDYQDEESASSSGDSFVSIEPGVRQMLTAVPPSPRPLIVPPSPAASVSARSTPATPRSHAGSHFGSPSRASSLYSPLPTIESLPTNESQPLSDISNRLPEPDRAHIAAHDGATGSAAADCDKGGGAEQADPNAEEQALLLDYDLSAQKQQPWYYNKQVLLALACYALVSFLFNLMDEVRPIFASTPIEDGGLNMTAESLAWSLSFGGVSFIVYVLLGYNRFYAAVGTIWCSRIGLMGVIPTALLIPITTLFAHNKIAVQANLFLDMAVNAVADISSYSGCNVLINAAGPPDAGGAVNGAGQAVSSFMRAIGPFVGGYAWSFSVGLNVPGHQYLVFVGTAVVAFLGQFLYAFFDLPNLDH